MTKLWATTTTYPCNGLGDWLSEGVLGGDLSDLAIGRELCARASYVYSHPT